MEILCLTRQGSVDLNGKFVLIRQMMRQKISKKCISKKREIFLFLKFLKYITNSKYISKENAFQTS